MQGKTVVMLAADLAAGAVTADYIKEHYGEGILSAVLALGGGVAAGIVTSTLLNSLERETGMVSDLGSLIDDIIDIF